MTDHPAKGDSRAGRRLRTLLDLCARSPRALWSAFRAHRRGLPGGEFDRRGRWFGLRLLTRLGAQGSALDLWLQPVLGPRHFELPFAKSCLPAKTDGHYLDVSSPRLFSLLVASERPAAKILMANPDVGDVRATELACQGLGLRNVTTRVEDIAEVRERKETFDCIWAISVIEHISGGYDDQQAVKWMYEMLKPGGRLILTFPVDRRFWVEYRKDDPYGVQPQEPGKGYFYQRYYDPGAIQERLLTGLAEAKTSFAWYGEVTPEWLNMVYEPNRRLGKPEQVFEDAHLMLQHCRTFESWEQMPGAGVCGLLIQKGGEEPGPHPVTG